MFAPLANLVIIFLKKKNVFINKAKNVHLSFVEINTVNLLKKP